MKKIILVIALILPIMLNAQDVLGTWKTVDDETGEAKSYVEIYKNNGKVYGKIIKLLQEKDQSKPCTACKGKDKDKPIVGLVILKNLSKDGAEFGGGTIMDPNNGKVYKCYITLEEDNKLKVRGYIGFSLMGRTQYWYRVN
ncbi:MAG: hypothetical protein CSA40_00670 [Flavobacteriales bacterium]|nr:MAG: hypothetical protein CSA40_00670 [Flavobacteriales bacterium]